MFLAMKNHNSYNILLMATFVAILSIVTGCAKDIRQDNNKNQADKSSSTYIIPLNRDEIDVLAKEIGTAHNCVLFALYQNPIIDSMDAASLCRYVHNFLVNNSDAMGLKVLPMYMSAADNYGNLIDDLYSNIGALFEKNDSVLILPDNVDHDLIMESMDEYFNFVNETFLKSNSYDEFETACMERLKELCDSTFTTEDYFFMKVGGNITFASYCAWITIFSGYNTTTKGLFRDGIEFLRKEFNKVKEFVAEAIVKPIADIVHADFRGGAIGGSATLVPGCIVAGSGNIVGGVGIFVGGWAVGAATGSIIYANN